MILLDANVLLCAHDSSDPRSEVVRAWLERTVSSEPDVRLPLTSALAFIRISTDPRVYERPRDPGEAIAVVEAMLSRANVSLAIPGARHWPLLARSAADGQARGRHLTDAHLAALAIEHGATLATTDRGFARYGGLRTLDPSRPGPPGPRPRTPGRRS
jgi:toxin-antitoxin system PIN domain toxin